MDNYEMNLDTLAIIPLTPNATRVIENNEELIVNANSMKIIDDGCRFYGSSYIGRTEGTKSLIGINYKAPIIVEETRPMIFFPTLSPRLNNCSWISFKNVDKCLKIGNKRTIIIFKSGKELVVDLSYNVVQNQILRASYLDSMLISRKFA